MSISINDISGIQSALKDPAGALSTPVSSLLAAGKDPIGQALTKAVSSINSLSVAISNKITKLEEDVVNSTNNTGKVKLVNNVIIVTLEPADAAKLPQYQAKIQGDINTINGSIAKLQVVTDTLKVVSESAKVIRTALDAQEIMLTIGNPVAKATMALIKNALKIIFYKDVLNEYSSIISQQVSSTTQSLNAMIAKFSKLSVQFVVNSDLNNGVITTKDQAKTALQSSALTTDNSNIPQDYTNQIGKTYVLAVEAYGSREIIGRARDKYSNLLVAETAPSFISSATQLIEELKVILNQ